MERMQLLARVNEVYDEKFRGYDPATCTLDSNAEGLYLLLLDIRKWLRQDEPTKGNAMDVQEFAKRFASECYADSNNKMRPMTPSWERLGDLVRRASGIEVVDLNEISPARPTLLDSLRARCEQAVAELNSQRMYQTEQARAEAFGEMLGWIRDLEKGKP